MTTDTLARFPRTFTLHRVHLDGNEEPVGEFTSFEVGWSAGTHAVTVEDTYGAYSLYVGGTRVARFAHARLLQAGFDAERVPETLWSL